MIYLLLIVATLVTSLISGVLSMAGGIILMGVFGFFLSVPAAMVLHGVAQTASNGSRIWLHRHHLKWNVFIPYSLGSLVIAIFFVWVAFVPDKAIIFLVIGSFPFLALLLPKHLNLNIEDKSVAFVCGMAVTCIQLLAGASGPVLDIFYTASKLNRFEILGTKAITQTLGHIIKLCYFAFFIEVVTGLPLWIFPTLIVAAILGSWIARHIIESIKDESFKKAGRYTIMVIGIIYMGKGLLELHL